MITDADVTHSRARNLIRTIGKNYTIKVADFSVILVGSVISWWRPYTSVILVKLRVSLSVGVSILQFRSPKIKYSVIIFLLFSFCFLFPI